MDICENYQLVSIIDGPTRVCGSSISALDVLLSNNPDSISRSRTVLAYFTDHHMIYGILQQNPALHQQPPILCRSMKKFDCKRFNVDLSNQPWKLMDSFCDVNSMWEYWKSLV